MKNKRAIILLLTANAVSGFAQGLSILSIPWYFVSVLDMSRFYGILFSVVTFCTLFWSLYAGTMVDKYDRKRIFQWINIIGFLFMSVVALYGYANGEVPVIGLCLAFAFTVFVFNIHYPSTYAFVQEITEKGNYGKYNSLLEIQGQATSAFAGFAIAMFLVDGGSHDSLREIIGVKWGELTMWEIIAIDAITYLIAFVLISAMKYESVAKREPDTANLVDRFKNGIKFLRKNPYLFYFGIASYMLFVVLLVEAFFLMQQYIHSYLNEGAAVYGIAEIGYTIGALFAGFAIRRIFRNQHYVDSIIVLMAMSILGCWWVGIAQDVWIFIAFSILIGLTNAGTRIQRITYIFEKIPNHLIGRSGSIFNAINIISRVILIMLFSLAFFQDEFSNRGYVVCGFFMLMFLIPLMIHRKKIKELEVVE